MFEACVIGCGQIGEQVMKALTDQYFNKDQIIGTDINSNTIENMESKGYRMTNPLAMPEAKVYFICVWDTDSVIDILSKLDGQTHIDSIFIETTVDPSAYDYLRDMIWSSESLHDKVIFFPHRFMENDPEHHIFNQRRLFGPVCQAAGTKGLEFLRKVMNTHLIEWCRPEIAVYSKVVENAYRAMEIIIAQEIKNACIHEGIDFDDLIKATNSKWNINIKEARDGVKGKCLPKDLALYNKFFGLNPLSKVMEALNTQYIKQNNV